MSERTELPWDEIKNEVISAVYEFNLTQWGETKNFVNLALVADYLYAKHRVVPGYEHLTGNLRNRTILNRCVVAMKLLGWAKFSKTVYVVPGEYRERKAPVGEMIVGGVQ